MISSDDILVEVFEHQGQLVAINNRGLATLSLADMRPTNVVRRAPTQAELKRLNETALFPDDRLPSTKTAITPGQNDLTILEQIDAVFLDETLLFLPCIGDTVVNP